MSEFWSSGFWRSKFWSSGFWGAEETSTHGGIAHGKRKKSQLVVVTIDGQDYRVPIEKLQAFLDSLKTNIQESLVVKRQVKKIRKAVTPKIEAPRIVVKSAPAEFMPSAMAAVDRSNEIMAGLWQRAIELALMELEDEETLLMLIA